MVSESDSKLYPRKERRKRERETWGGGVGRKKRAAKVLPVDESERERNKRRDC